jgi:hypothetical protein
LDDKLAAAMGKYLVAKMADPMAQWMVGLMVEEKVVMLVDELFGRKELR